MRVSPRRAGEISRRRNERLPCPCRQAWLRLRRRRFAGRGIRQIAARGARGSFQACPPERRHTRMTPMRAAGTRILALVFLSAVAGTGLAGCASIDDALFGGEPKEAAQPPANAAPEAQAAPAPGTPVPPPAPVVTGEMAPAPVVTGA